MLKPLYSQDGITVLNGDCRELTGGDGTIRLILTDPPYNLSTEGTDIIFHDRADMTRDFGPWDRGEWDPKWLLDTATRLLYPGGSMLAFSSDRLISEFRMHEGLKPRGTIVWEKTNPSPAARPMYVSATEWIVWLHKDKAPAVWNANGFQVNILRYPVCRGRERTKHPTQKPLALMENLIARHSNKGDLILDPYMGSGTTLRAAKNLGRRAIGIDLNPEWCELAVKRLGQDVFDFNEESDDPDRSGGGSD